MCSATPHGGIPLFLLSCKPRRTRVRVLIRPPSLKKQLQREERIGKDMELKNLKLYMENINIFEENEKLRKQACLLHQENLALMSELQKKFDLIKRPSK